MSKINILYQGSFSTCCIKEDTGARFKTDLENEFSPIDLFAGSLGACFMTLVSLKAKKLCLDISGSRIEVTRKMSNNPGRVSAIRVDFFCPLRFTPEIEQEIEIAGKTCPIHYSLHPGISQEFLVHWGVF